MFHFFLSRHSNQLLFPLQSLPEPLVEILKTDQLVITLMACLCSSVVSESLLIGNETPLRCELLPSLLLFLSLCKAILNLQKIGHFSSDLISQIGEEKLNKS